MKRLKSELGEEEVSLKRTERSMEVLDLQLKALEEREGELEREGREVGSTLDTGHLERLESHVEAFERGGEGGREGGREGGGVGGERREGGNRVRQRRTERGVRDEGKREEKRKEGDGEGGSMLFILFLYADHEKAVERAGEGGVRGEAVSKITTFTTAHCDRGVKLTLSCRLHDEIMAVARGRLKPQQAMVDRLVKEIDEANGAITKATVGIKTNERYT